MNSLTYILISLDLCLIGLIVHFVLQLRSGEKRQGEKEKRLQQLNENITKLIIQAEIVTQTLTHNAEVKEKSLAGLLEQIEAKENHWLKLMKAWSSSDNFPTTTSDTHESDKAEKYKLAQDLAGKGLSPLQIARQVDLPLGEIELLINLIV